MRTGAALALIVVVACGENTSVDGGPGRDAGPSSCPAWKAPVGCTASSLEDRLKCVPGLKGGRRADAGSTGYEIYDLTLVQPVDHDRPDAGSFEQRVRLYHAQATAPMVLMTSGYTLSAGSELSREFGTNVLAFEHRYFGSSRPSTIDYRTLTIRQAAGDSHRIAEALHWLYPAKWVSTGVSKGGMTALFDRRFFPCDVDATVAYSAPLTVTTADPAYVPFLANVGGDRWASCRADLVALQKRLLAKRDTLSAKASGSFTILPRDKAFELAVVELYFGFWQYSDPDDVRHGCESIPNATASDDEMLDFLEYHSPPEYLAGDVSLENFSTYYYQALNEIGFPQPFESNLTGLLRYPGGDQAETYLLPSIPVPAYDAEAMTDISQWLATEGVSVMLIYGEFDPWAARQFELGQATDSYRFVAPGGNHGSGLWSLSPTDHTSAIAIMERWLGTKASRPLVPTRVDLPERVRR